MVRTLFLFMYTIQWLQNNLGSWQLVSMPNSMPKSIVWWFNDGHLQQHRTHLAPALLLLQLAGQWRVQQPRKRGKIYRACGWKDNAGL